MSWWGNVINKFQLDFNYQDADVATAMKDVKTPVLIINNKKNSLTFYYFIGKDIYDKIVGGK